MYIYAQAFIFFFFFCFFFVEPLVPIRRWATGLVPRLIFARIARSVRPRIAFLLVDLPSRVRQFANYSSSLLHSLSFRSPPPPPTPLFFYSRFFFFPSIGPPTTQHPCDSPRAEKVALSAREVNLNVRSWCSKTDPREISVSSSGNRSRGKSLAVTRSNIDSS